MPERLIDRLSKDQIEAIFDTLPIEFAFIDENDCLQYYNKGEERSRRGSDNILGNDIRECHKPESMPRTDKMLSDFKTGEKDEDEFWIDGLGIKFLNTFLAVRDKSGKYLGCIEIPLDFTPQEQLAEAKNDSYKFVVDQGEQKKPEDNH